MRVCPNREQSCGKPKECEWKLLLRGAESTRRCISVAFSDADKRCLENCRNFSGGGKRGGGPEKREKRDKERWRGSCCIGGWKSRRRRSRGEAKRTLLDGTLTHMEKYRRRRALRRRTRKDEGKRMIDRSRGGDGLVDRPYSGSRGGERTERLGLRASARKEKPLYGGIGKFRCKTKEGRESGWWKDIDDEHEGRSASSMRLRLR